VTTTVVSAGGGAAVPGKTTLRSTQPDTSSDETDAPQPPEQHPTGQKQNTARWFRHGDDQIVQTPTGCGYFYAIQTGELRSEIKRLEIRHWPRAVYYAVGC
jgi:hypothetical protein